MKSKLILAVSLLFAAGIVSANPDPRSTQVKAATGPDAVTSLLAGGALLAAAYSGKRKGTKSISVVAGAKAQAGRRHWTP